MLTPLSGRPQELRVLIADFLSERRDGKLDKLDPDDPGHAELHAQFQSAVWLADAARRVAQIQGVTHSLKPVHPDAKGTNLYCAPDSLTAQTEVGSHSLGANFVGDVVGNAAALDVHKFLKLTHQNRTLLDLMRVRDPDLALALSIDPEQANTWIDAFAGIVEPRGKVASHALAKQLYWLAGENQNPLDDGDYHLLAPLYASSLAHRVFQTVNEDRFGDAAKAARQARRDGAFTEQVVHEYPQMAVQKLGGTKPQNISQLNSERGGNNYLLASLPPIWKSGGIQPLLGVTDMFRRYEVRPEVRRTIKALLAFLKSPAFLKPGLATKQENDTARDDLVGTLIDELIQFTAELRTLAPGWSHSAECELSAAQMRWLDPDAEAAAATEADEIPSDLETTPLWQVDSADAVSKSFARWLNELLRKGELPVGDAEYQYWRSLISEQLREDDLEVKT